jgi:PAS domain S-box-containing protein
MINLKKNKAFLSLFKRGFVGLSMLFVILVSGVAYSVDRLNDAYATSLKSINTHNLIETLNTGISDIESGARGYSIFKQNIFLDSYYKGSSSFHESVNKIKPLIADNPEQVKILEEIIINFNEWETDLKSTLILQEKKPTSLKEGLERKYTVDTLRSSLNNINSIELTKLYGYLKEEKKAKNFVVLWSFLSTLLPLSTAFYLQKKLGYTAEKFIENNEQLNEEMLLRKELETKLFKAISLYGEIIKISPEPIILMDGNGIIHNFNPAAENLFGYKQDDAIGKEFAVMLVPDEYSIPFRTNFKKFNDVIDDSLSQISTSTKGKKSDGTLFPIEVIITKVDLKDSTIFVGFIKETKPRKSRKRNEV